MAERAHAVRQPAPADAGRLRILSVEDDALNRALLRATLSRARDRRFADAELVEAASIAEARLALGAGDFDLVLLDRRLPDGDGFQLAAELSGAKGIGRPRVVALTADAVPETRDSALKAGCHGMVTKPYVPSEMLALLARQLDMPDPA